MDEQVYNEIRNRKERLKQSLKQTLEKEVGGDDTLELMLHMLDNCRINVNDKLKGEEYEE